MPTKQENKTMIDKVIHKMDEMTLWRKNPLKQVGTKLDQGTMLLTQPHCELLPKVQLEIVSGPFKGKKFTLRQGTYKIGRSQTCDITIKDATISSKHAVIQYEKKNKLTLHDAGSTNGISMDGKKKQTLVAKQGHVVQVGGVHMKIHTPDCPSNWTTPIKACMATVVLLMICLTGFALQSDHAFFSSNVAVNRSVVKKPPATVLQKKSVTKTRTNKQKIKQAATRPAVKKQVAPTVSQAQEKQLAIQKLRHHSNQLFQEGKYQKAFATWLDLFRLHPGDTVAVQGFAKLEKMAKGFLEEAMMAGVYSHKGVSLLKKITSMTHAQQRVHQVAQKYLNTQRS